MCRAPADSRDRNQLKPVSFDPETEQFITYDDAVAGTARMVPLDRLDPEQITRLVVEGHRVGPDFTMGDLSGRSLTRDEVIAEIEAGSDFGRMVVEAETAYLADLQKQIAERSEPG